MSTKELIIPDDGSELYFCGARAAELNRAGRGQMRWGKRELAWCLGDRLAGMTREQQIADTVWAFDQWRLASNGYFSFAETLNSAQADIILTTRRIDRSGGVLAEMQLPPGDDRQIRGWFDTSEQWNVSILYRLVLLHELGHAMGMDHISGATAVLNPVYNPRLTVLQPADVKVLLGIYPEAATIPPTPVPTTPTTPAPTPAPVPDGAQLTLTINVPLAPGVYKLDARKILG